MGAINRRTWMGIMAAGGLTARMALTSEDSAPKPKGRIFFSSAEQGPLSGFFAYDVASRQWERLVDRDRTMAGASVSPDGKTLAYSRSIRDGNQIKGDGTWTVDLTREAPSRRVCEIDGRAVWAPDGKSLIASGPVGIGNPYFETWNVVITDNEKSRISIPADEIVVDWSPDKKRLLICRQTSYLTRSFDGTDPIELGKSNSLFNHRFSADSRKIVCSERIQEDKLYENRLRVVDVIGVEPSQLVPLADGSHASFFCLSPDGAWLAVNLTEEGTTSLTLLSFDGRAKESLNLPHPGVFPLDRR